MNDDQHSVLNEKRDAPRNAEHAECRDKWRDAAEDDQPLSMPNVPQQIRVARIAVGTPQRRRRRSPAR
jgi:hypothetical protein